jgi:ABC-2 type transport system permease protein
MNKLGLIIRREYLTRIRKKSFIFATIAVPLGLALVPVLIVLLSAGQDDERVAVVDASGWFKNKMTPGMNITFNYPDQTIDSVKQSYRDMNYTGILFIPSFDPQNPKGIQYYSHKGLGCTAQYYIQEELSRELEIVRLSKAGVPDSLVANLKSKNRYRIDYDDRSRGEIGY